MNEHDLKITIEATLLAAGRPVTLQQLLDLFEERDRPTSEQVQAALEQLSNDYAERGIELAEVASGWRIQVRQRCMDVVSRLWQERPSKYSRALLETLALVAYRQPITRSEIEEIRGVSISSTIMRTLQERNWIRVVGHREVPGRPELLGTTRDFLDYFGLKSLDQLPTLAELRDVETIGVQLELPGGETTVDTNVEANAEPAVEPAVESDETVAASETAGSQLEASDHELAADESSEDEADDADAVSDASVDETELSADAEETDDDDDDDDDDDETSTLVASDDDDEERKFAEPPRDE